MAITSEDPSEFDQAPLASGGTGDGAQGEGSSIYLVGVNITSKSAWWHKHNQNLDRVSECVYLPCGMPYREREAVLRSHALRIAQLNRPSAVLCGSSAYHLSAVAGSVAMCSDRGSRLKEVPPGLAIHCFSSSWLYDAGPAALTTHQVSDSLGSFQIRSLSDELLLLDAFSASYGRPVVTMLNQTDIEELASKVLRSNGGLEPTLARLERLAERTGMRRQMSRLKERLERKVAYDQPKKFMYDFAILWSGRHVASLQCDAGDWNMRYERSCAISLSLNETVRREQVPTFLASLLPERGIRAHEEPEDGFNEFSIADRYLSNITVRPINRVLQSVVIDQLHGKLADHVDEKLGFAGAVGQTLVTAFGKPELSEKLSRDRKSPRLSGVQFKLPCHLSADGTLEIAHDKAFTHILKVASSNPDVSTMASVEFFTMHMAAACGLETEHFVAIDVGAGAPAFLAERFDIREDASDKSMILAEDFWSVMGMRRNMDKYGADLNQVGEVIRRHCTNPDEDARRLYRQVVFSWVAGNNDMHLKNLMLIKVANQALDGFDTVRLSPAYDLLCTQVYPGVDERAALNIGNEGMYNLGLLRTLAHRLKITPNVGDEIIIEVVNSIGRSLQAVVENLPDVILAHELSVEHISRAAMFMATRCADLGAEFTASPKAHAKRLRFKGPGGSAGEDPGASFSF